MTTSPVAAATSRPIFDAHLAGLRIYHRVGYFRIFLNQVCIDLEGEFLKDAPQVLVDWRAYVAGAARLGWVILGELEAACRGEREAARRLDANPETPLLRAYWRFEAIQESLKDAERQFEDSSQPFVDLEAALKTHLLTALTGCLVWQDAVRNDLEVPADFDQSWADLTTGEGAFVPSTDPPNLDEIENALKGAERAIERCRSALETDKQFALEQRAQDGSGTPLSRLLERSSLASTTLGAGGSGSDSNPALDMCMAFRKFLLTLLQSILDLPSLRTLPQGLQAQIQRGERLLDEACEVIASIYQFYVNLEPNHATTEARELKRAKEFLKLITHAFSSQRRRLDWITGLFTPASDHSGVPAADETLPIHLAAWANSPNEVPPVLNELLCL
jgi:hypothetical protein